METEPRSRLRPPVAAAAPAHRPVPIFGPGLVAGASANDPTTVASLALVGSATAYGLAWLVVLLLPMLALVQTIAANVATVTHSSLQQTIVRTYGRPVATVAFGLVAAVGFVTLAADLKAGADALTLLLGIPPAYFVVPIAAAAAALLATNTYLRIERMLAGLTLVFVCYIASAFYARPDWSAVLRGIFWPHLAWSLPFVTGAIALLGTTLTSYTYFWESIEIYERRPALTQLRAVGADAALGMLLAGSSFIFILIATAATAGRQHLPIATAADAAQALRPLAGGFARGVFAAGLLASAAIAIPVVAATNGYVTAHTFGLRGSLRLRPREAPAFYLAIVATLAASAAVALLPLPTIALLYWASIIAGIATPVTLALLIAVARNPVAMRGRPIRRRTAAAGWLVTGIVAAAALAFFVFAATSVARAQTTPSPSPAATPLHVRGFVRSYYFTRQNASNNPGVQYDDTTHKCDGAGPCVNQVSWNSAVGLHADYDLGGGWSAGGSYFYAQPFTGPCSPAATHAKGQSCVSQDPPNTNPDDTLPGFALSTFPEAYLAYKRAAVSATIGDQMFDSPWAAPYDGSRLKPAAYQGAAVKYAPGGWTFELADMLQFESRTNNAFESATLLTSHPAGAAGVPDDIYVPGGGSITTAGFLYARAGFADSARGYAFNGYVYAVSDIVTMWWIDGRYELSRAGWKPFVAVQGGLENDNGAAVIGKIRSSVAGIRLGATPARDVAVDLSADTIPWRSDTLRLPAPVTCSNSSHQIAAGAKVYPGTTFAYFLPVDAAQCVNNPGGTATVYYGGWASPYTDSYSADPLFTTQITQGMADRRSPGFSWRLSATYTSPNRRVVFIAGDAWFDYGNALAAQVTNEWTLDGQYHFSPVAHDRYRGLLLRYRYAQREQSNAQELGGLPLFKYNRAQMEYDF